MMRNIVILALVAVSLMSCKTSSKTLGGKKGILPVGYVQWVEDEQNGLRIIEEDGSYIYELQYQPVEYLAVMQSRDLQIKSSVIKEEYNKRGSLQYFTLKMSKINGKGILSDKDLQIEDRNTYILSGLQKDMMLLEGQDTLQCAILHFESSNNLIPYDQCVLAFEEPVSKKEDIVFLFRTDIYQKGWLRMTIKRENIKKIPQLKTI